MIIIDGTTFNVGIVSMRGNANTLDRSAERVATGRLERQLIGVFYSYDLEFATSVYNPTAYTALWQKLTEPVPWHIVVFPTVLGQVSFEGYFAQVRHEVIRLSGNTIHWKNLSASFVSRDKRV